MTTATHSGNHGAAHRIHGVLAILGQACLLIVFGLAFVESTLPTLADKVTLPILAVVIALLVWTPWRHVCENNASAAGFAFCAVWFVVYGIARNAGPTAGWTWEYGATVSGSETRFVISYAARCVMAGALLTAPIWVRHWSGWTRAAACALAVVAVIAAGSTLFLRNYYKIDPDGTLDPTALLYLAQQTVEYCCLVLVCGVVAGHPFTRRWLLRALPILLMALWVRHCHTLPPPPEDE